MERWSAGGELGELRRRRFSGGCAVWARRRMRVAVLGALRCWKRCGAGAGMVAHSFSMPLLGLMMYVRPTLAQYDL